jgi:hypothetical protein
MTDDLVKRLRGYPGKRGMEKPFHVTMDEAADRIEKLEAALKHCINALQQYEMGDNRPRGPIPNDDLRPWLLGAMDNAIKVLEGKDD